ncbi:MAG: FAD-binding oxidoreductase [candidate division Zixibacteria bacterium]|nr:FAD-binding oxidoreductase [candidate division Zixibacteria bacterium]
MTRPSSFIKIIESEFPDDRLTYQKSIPTFHPENSQEAATLFKLANKKSQRLYISGFGNHIDPIGETFKDLIIVRTDRLNNLLEIVPDDLYVVVGSGYPLREINLNLRSHNLCLPHSALPYVGSIGGAVGTGLTGFMHDHDVPLAKYFIQAEIVTPQGEIIKPGSACFKSVSGYDIVKLYAGSWGLLGLIVSATFRVMPSTGADDFATMIQKEISRAGVLAALGDADDSADAIYSRKIKQKFDPNNILPLVR